MTTDQRPATDPEHPAAPAPGTLILPLSGSFSPTNRAFGLTIENDGPHGVAVLGLVRDAGVPPAPGIGVQGVAGSRPEITPPSPGIDVGVAGDALFGIGVWGTTGVGTAGKFEMHAPDNDNTSSNPAVEVATDALGPAGAFRVENPSNLRGAVEGDNTAGAGPGVLGSATRDDGVRGVSDRGAGLHGVANRGVGVFATGALAGEFIGNVLVFGRLIHTGGGFLIDHPLEPEARYLSHSTVESPEMKTVSDGVVDTDTAGRATVELPDWFEALNTDLRYQLTPLDAPAPRLHIAAELAGGTFSIAGAEPGTRVCWQITGVRADPWARAHRLVADHPKPAHERGRYLHPDLYGADHEDTITQIRHPAATHAATTRGGPGPETR